MWKDTAEAQQVAIDIDKNRTATAINAKVEEIAQTVKLQVQTQGLQDLQLLEHNVGTYLNGRVGAFNAAVAQRHAQVLQTKAAQFATLKDHQGKLMQNLVSDIVGHGYAVAKTSVAQAAQAAALSFNSNPEIKTALKSVDAAEDKWTHTYQVTEAAARQGYHSWNGAYHNFNDPWNNITATFQESDLAAKAATGLGSDTRWAQEVARVSGDVVAAAQTEAGEEAGRADLSFDMATKAARLVNGNSGLIVKLTEDLEQAEKEAGDAEAKAPA